MQCVQRLVLTMFLLMIAMPVLAEEMPSVRVSTSTTGKADIENKGGEYSVTKVNVDASYRWFSLVYTHADYDWKHSSALPFGKRRGDPWNTLSRLALDGNLDGSFNEALGWFGGITVASGFEDELSDSFSLMGRGGLRWEINPEMRLRAGVIGMLSPVHSMILPLIGFDWGNEYDDGFSATIGAPYTTIRYRFNPMISVSAASRWERELYRLSDDSSVSRKGYMEDSGYTSGVYLGVTPLDGLNITLGAEYLTGRLIRLYEDSGDRIDKYSVENALGGSLRLRYAF